MRLIYIAVNVLTYYVLIAVGLYIAYTVMENLKCRK